MSENSSSNPIRPLGLVAARRGLAIGGVALVALNLVIMMTGSLTGGGASLVSALLWGGAAFCFLGAFVVFMLEPMKLGKDEGPGSPAAKQLAGPSLNRVRDESPKKDANPKETDVDKTAEPSEGAPMSEAPAVAVGAPLKGSDDASPATPPATDEVPNPEAAPGANEAAKEEPSSVPGAPLLRRGNPLRTVRGGVAALAGSFIAYLFMAHPGQLRLGVPLGALFVAVAAWGIVDFLGTFDDADDRVVASHRFDEVAPHLAGFIASVLLFLCALGFAHAGRGLPQWAWGLVVTATFVLGVVALYRLGRSMGAWPGEDGAPAPPIYQRYGFWVVVIGAVLYFPFMGSYALWDPWETHYGEVSREILAKDDWISLWWAQDGWFWSKPVLDMWMQALTMATLGVHYRPDQMLVGEGTAPVYHPEWAVRAPVVLLTILALYLLYKGVAKTFGKRPALLGALVLATMPDWFFIAHQTMTDMPFVGAMTACMGLVLIGLRTPEDQEVRAYEVRVGAARLRFTAWHLVFGAVVLCAVPQILYLVSRNLELLWKPGAHGFHPHWDEFWSGSGGGNCGLPGNEDCKLTSPATTPHAIGTNPEGLLNGPGASSAASSPPCKRSMGRRPGRRPLHELGRAADAAPLLSRGLVFCCHLDARQRPRGLRTAHAGYVRVPLRVAAARGIVDRILRIVRELTQFEIVGGLLLVLAVALPWYVAMYVRHGSPFTDRLIFHDMVNRAFMPRCTTPTRATTRACASTCGSSATRSSRGRGSRPWLRLGLLWWLRRGTTAEDNDRADSSVLLCMWFVFAFALFSFMGTKFHHYILPAVPPVAMLIGIVLDDMIGRAAPARGVKLVAYVAGMLVGAGMLVVGFSRTQAGSFYGVKPDGRLPDASIGLGIAMALFGAGVLIVSAWLFGDSRDERDAAPEPEDTARSHTSRMLAAGAVAGSLLLR